MDVHPVRLLPVKTLRQNPYNPKRPIGAKYKRGLQASLKKFGFAGLFVVNDSGDGSYEILDGNTRLDELTDAGISSVPCVVLSLDETGRREFVLAYDRHRKQFDDNQVVQQLKELARTAPIGELQTLSGVDNLQRIGYSETGVGFDSLGH